MSAAIVLGVLFSVTHAVETQSASGDLDPTFGAGGILILDTGTSYSMVLQPDGKIVGGGGDAQLANYQITRLNPNGTRDTSFGTGGDLIIDFAGNCDSVGCLQRTTAFFLLSSLV